MGDNESDAAVQDNEAGDLSPVTEEPKPKRRCVVINPDWIEDALSGLLVLVVAVIIGFCGGCTPTATMKPASVQLSERYTTTGEEENETVTVKVTPGK